MTACARAATAPDCSSRALPSRVLLWDVKTAQAGGTYYLSAWARDGSSRKLLPEYKAADDESPSPFNYTPKDSYCSPRSPRAQASGGLPPS